MEDLRGLQRACARKNGRRVNGRVNSIPTGKLKSSLTAACEDAGISLDFVDPAGTSKLAPGWFDVTGEKDSSYKHRTSALLVARAGLGLPIDRDKSRSRRASNRGWVPLDLWAGQEESELQGDRIEGVGDGLPPPF